jgi:hypothetical protein
MNSLQLLFRTGLTGCPVTQMVEVIDEHDFIDVNPDQQSLISLVENELASLDMLSVFGEVSSNTGGMKFHGSVLGADWWRLTSTVGLIYAHVCYGVKLFVDHAPFLKQYGCWISYSGRIYFVSGPRRDNEFSKAVFDGIKFQIQLGISRHGYNRPDLIKNDINNYLLNYVDRLENRIIKGEKDLNTYVSILRILAKKTQYGNNPVN